MNSDLSIAILQRFSWNFLEKERKICLIKLDRILRGGNLSHRRGLSGVDFEITPNPANRRKIRAGGTRQNSLFPSVEKTSIHK
jgi:hypothetical protein